MTRVGCRGRARASLLVLALAASSAAAQDAAGVRAAPDLTRDSIARLVATALADGPDRRPARAEALALASRYADAWDDPFILARTRFLLGLGSAEARRFLAADRLRRAGSAQLFREGPPAARASWREAAGHLAAIGDSAGITQLTGNIGAAFYEEGRLDSAALHLERTRRAATRRGDRRAAANAATILSSIALERGEARAAAELNRQALDLHRAAGDLRGAAADLNTAGMIAEASGDLDAAERSYLAALDLAAHRLGGERAADYQLNLGALAMKRGASGAARTWFARAAALYAGSGESRNEAIALRNLGALDAAGADFATAAPELRRARDLFARSGDLPGTIDARRLLAATYAATGRIDEALEELVLATRALSRLDPPDPALEASVAVARGDLELMLNRGSDASRQYQDAIRAARRAGDGARTAAATQGRALVDQRRGRHDLAVAALDPVARAQADGRERAWSMLLLGVSRTELGDSGAARASIEYALAQYRRAGDRLGAALAAGALADWALGQQRPALAQRLSAEALARSGDLPSVRWWLHLGAGRAAETAGDLPRAAASYDSAVADVERLADGVRFEDRRTLFLDDKWEAYAAAASVAARSGNAGRALALSERLRARQMLDRLADARRPGPGDNTLRAEERRLHRRVQELGAAIVEGEDGRRGGASLSQAEAREALLAAQTQYRRVIEQIADSEPAYLRSLRAEPALPDELRQAVAPGQLLLEYLVTDRAVWIFAMTDSAVMTLPVGVSRAELRTRVDFARWAMQARANEPALWRGALRELDRLLLGPVRSAGLLAGHGSLVIVPHLELHYLPFEALIEAAGGGDRYLVQTHDVSYAPSLSAWLRLGQRPRGVPSGVLALAPLDAVLEGTGREVVSIRAAWGDAAAVRTAAAATESVILGADARYRIVHLATRGVLDRLDPLFSYVQLAPAGGDNGRLEVAEVLRLRLRTDLLVLTACETSLGSGATADVPNGDEWIGLVRAFLQAGANNVIATLWAVDDRRTAWLAASLHRHIAAGDDYAHALAEAKRAAIASPDESAPYYWAGLVLHGASAASPASNR